MSVTISQRATGPAKTKYAVMTALLGLPVTSEADEFRLTEVGLPTRAIKQLVSKLRIESSHIAPETTVRRRYRENAAFTTDESERALRLARVYAEARMLFGDDESTQAWFRRPVVLVNGQPARAPMELVATETGARLVESRLRRTAYGML